MVCEWVRNYILTSVREMTNYIDLHTCQPDGLEPDGLTMELYNSSSVLDIDISELVLQTIF